MSELSPETRAWIDAAGRGDAPRAEDRARIRQKLALELGAAALASTAVVTVTAHAAGGALPTGATLAVGKASAGIGLFAKLAIAATIAGAVSTGALLSMSAPAQDGKVDVKPALSVRKAALIERAAPEAMAEAPVVEPLALEETAQAAPIEASAAKKALAPKHSDAKPVARSNSQIAEELALLREAHIALREGRLADAVARTDELATRFPNGVMREERMAVALLAACAKGSVEGAELAAFLEKAPESPLKARVESACEGK